MDRLRLGLITAGFLGCAPVAPGTFGTLAGVLIAWALRSTQPFLAVLLGICVVLYLVGRALAPWAEKEHGKDPGCFVLDEVIGYLICVAWVLPPAGSPWAWHLCFSASLTFSSPGPCAGLSSLVGATASCSMMWLRASTAWG